LFPFWNLELVPAENSPSQAQKENAQNTEAEDSPTAESKNYVVKNDDNRFIG
jgi:hypothetical protein